MIPAKYSISWARSIVKRLKEQHGRATDLVCEFLEINDETLARYLARGDYIFPQLRMFIHIVDDWQNTDNWRGWTPNNCVAVWEVLHCKGYDRICKRLDSLNFRHRIKEQESSGGPAAYSPGDPQPFVTGPVKEERFEDLELPGGARPAAKRCREEQSVAAPRGRPSRSAKKETEEFPDCNSCGSPCLFRAINLGGGVDGKQCRPYDGCTGKEHGYQSPTASSGCDPA